MPPIEVITQLLNLGWPAMVTVAVVYVFKRYTDSLNDQIAYLRKRIDDLEARQKQLSERLS